MKKKRRGGRRKKGLIESSLFQDRVGRAHRSKSKQSEAASNREDASYVRGGECGVYEQQETAAEPEGML